MTAVLVTTVFTPAFRMTLAFGLPFLAVLALAYAVRGRRSSSEGAA
jgi:L-asparagine transporter-like permease